jgi:hypothetical protein
MIHFYTTQVFMDERIQKDTKNVYILLFSLHCYKSVTTFRQLTIVNDRSQLIVLSLNYNYLCSYFIIDIMYQTSFI